MTHLARGLAAAIGALFALAGCATILAPQPDTSKFFVLTASADSSAAPAAGAGTGDLAIGLGPVQMPPYLNDRDEIATRVDSNQIRYSATDHWAEPLDANFSRVLAKNLIAAMPDAQLVSFPWYRSASLDYRIEVDVEHFESDERGDSRLTARWTIKDGKTGRLLVARESTIDRSAQSRGTEASVAALSGDIGELSDRIAAAVRELREEKRASGPAARTH